MAPIESAPSVAALPEAIQELRQDPEYRPISGSLYHYTSLDALVSICASKKLRATSVHYLNDASESELGLSLILEAAKTIAPEGKVETEFWTYFEAWLSARLFEDASVYVLCFSEVGNTLGQWRGYTPHGRGVCLAIDSALLVRRMKALGWSFQNCRYQRKSQESWARAIVRRMIHDAKELIAASGPDEMVFNEVINRSLSDLLQVAATIKAEAFHEEKEVRFISPTIETADARVSFRIGRSALIPFVEFDLVEDSQDTLRFDQLVVGPILQAVLNNLKSCMTTRCTVYVAPRIRGSTFQISSEGITALSRADTGSWDRIARKGYSTNRWEPATGKYASGQDLVFSQLKYDYVFICEETGTQKATKFSAALKLRRFFAVIFCVVSEKEASPLTKCAADPYTLCLQFSGPPSPDGVTTTSGIGELVPYYIDDHVLTNEDVVAIQTWFESLAKLPSEKARRIEKGAHFINKAMNSNDIESYVNYFVALDAFFGERGSVESSILSGVASLGVDPSMVERASWLFDLRNELVHGGSRYIREWPKYRRYYRHFDSRPESDIEKLAFTSLRHTPVVFAAAN